MVLPEDADSCPFRDALSKVGALHEQELARHREQTSRLAALLRQLCQAAMPFSGSAPSLVAAMKEAARELAAEACRGEPGEQPRIEHVIRTDTTAAPAPAPALAVASSLSSLELPAEVELLPMEGQPAAPPGLIQLPHAPRRETEAESEEAESDKELSLVWQSVTQNSHGIVPAMAPGFHQNTTSSVLPQAHTSMLDMYGFQWQWEHRDGWRNYIEQENVRIENSYQRGDQKIRLKTGKNGTTPMEIWFRDMVQFDPITFNTRRVRREGPEGAFARTKRRVAWWTQMVQSGRFRPESFHRFQVRRKALSMGSTETVLQVRELYANRHVRGLSDLGLVSREVVRSNIFVLVSTIVVMLNILWLGIDAELNPTASFMEAPLLFQIIEGCFAAFYTAEVVMRAIAFSHRCDCLKDVWFLYDAVVVGFMLIELVVMPVLFLVSGFDDSVTRQLMPLVRLLRIGRLARVARLLRTFRTVMTLIKSIMAAMRSVLATIMLLTIMLFVFGIIFRTQAPEFGLDEYFCTLLLSMQTLLLRGAFLDGATELVDAMLAKEAHFLLVVYFLFLFMCNMTLMNLLVGILCTVASSVSDKELQAAERRFLQSQLMDIFEAYDKDNDQRVGVREFDLILANPDVHEILKQYGVDPHSVKALKEVLFSERLTKLPFQDLLMTILRLRGGQNASVKDIVELREFMVRRFERLSESQSLQHNPVVAVSTAKVSFREAGASSS